MNILVLVIISLTIIAIINRLCEMRETQFMQTRELIDFLERHEEKIEVKVEDKENE